MVALAACVFAADRMGGGGSKSKPASKKDAKEMVRRISNAEGVSQRTAARNLIDSESKEKLEQGRLRTNSEDRGINGDDSLKAKEGTDGMPELKKREFVFEVSS